MFLIKVIGPWFYGIDARIVIWHSNRFSDLENHQRYSSNDTGFNARNL